MSQDRPQTTADPAQTLMDAAVVACVAEGLAPLLAFNRAYNAQVASS